MVFKTLVKHCLHSSLPVTCKSCRYGITEGVVVDEAGKRIAGRNIFRTCQACHGTGRVIPGSCLVCAGPATQLVPVSFYEVPDPDDWEAAQKITLNLPICWRDSCKLEVQVIGKFEDRVNYL